MTCLCRRIRTSAHSKSFRNKEGPFSLLSLAVIHGYFDLATLLLLHGYNPNRYELYVFLKIIQNSVGEIDDDGRFLTECYVAASFRQKTHEERVMLDNLLVPPNDGFEKETIDWVKQQIACPSLKALTRMAIRHAVQQRVQDCSIYKDLWTLPLPTLLKKYVRLDEYSLNAKNNPTYNLPQQCVCCSQTFPNVPWSKSLGTNTYY